MEKSRRLEFTGQNTRRENSVEHGDLQGMPLEYAIKDRSAPSFEVTDGGWIKNQAAESEGTHACKPHRVGIVPIPTSHTEKPHG